MAVICQAASVGNHGHNISKIPRGQETSMTKQKNQSALKRLHDVNTVVDQLECFKGLSVVITIKY